MEKDIFGNAFKDFLGGDTSAVFKVHTDITDTEDLAVEYFFRDFEKLPAWEQLALDNCKGRVLDVGAGAGSHALILQQRGFDVTALDISPGAVEVMTKRGIKNAVCDDFFLYQEKGFDTLLFLMNGTGMAQTLPGLENLFVHCRKLLKPGGSILLESADLMYMYEDEDGAYCIPMNENYYGEINYQIEYMGIKGNPFPWLFADFDSMASVAMSCGFSVQMLFHGESLNYLAKLTLED